MSPIFAMYFRFHIAKLYFPRHYGLASLLRPYGDPGRSEDAIDAGGTQ